MKRTATSFKLAIFLAGTIFFAFSTNSAFADDLLKTIQTDLTALGYDVGPADGELTMKTQLAIGKFEGANNLPVTGEPSFNLAVATIHWRAMSQTFPKSREKFRPWHRTWA